MRPSGAHTHPDGGPAGWAATAVLALFILAALAGPVVAAVTALLHLLVLVAAITGGLAVTATAAVVVWRVRHRHRPVPWVHTALPGARPAPVLAPPRGPRPALGRGGDVHLHLHGVSPADIAAALAHLNDDEPPAGTGRSPW